MKALSSKILLTLGIAAFCFVGARLLWPPIDLLLVVAAGRGPDCSVFQAAKASVRRCVYDVAAGRLRQHSHFVERDKDGYSLIETPAGSFWEPANGDRSEVLAQLAEIESKYSAGARPAIHAGDVVLDCGANVGVFTREALKRGASLVIAIEPVPQNIECIRRNLRAEITSGRVIIYPKGVWDKDDVLTINESNNGSAEDSFVRTAETHPGPSLLLTTIDKMTLELGLQRVDFIKMDIEGSEPKALVGGQQTLRRFRPGLEVEVSGNEREILDIARRAWHGYGSQCLTCDLDPKRKTLYTTLITLNPRAIRD